MTAAHGSSSVAKAVRVVERNRLDVGRATDVGGQRVELLAAPPREHEFGACVQPSSEATSRPV